MYRNVLTFWFEETALKQWWIADPGFDAVIRERFLPLLEQATCGELYLWRDTPQGRLAEIIVLDQFSRNIHRNTPQAFANDPIALVLAQHAVAAEAYTALTEIERSFLLMPYMHSESPRIHAVAEGLFREHASTESCRFELRHKEIIDRFGRYPHRNAILGRIPTPEEVEFLKQPGSSF